MTNPSHLKVRYLYELPELPLGEVENSWTYTYVPNGPDKDYKVFLPTLIEEAVDGVSADILQTAADYTDQETDQIRQELLDTADGLGTDMVAYRLDAQDAEARSLRDKLGDVVSVKDFGAAGDGITDDTAAFMSLEAVTTGAQIDLGGGTYKVDSLPSGNRYVNGRFKVGDIVHSAERTVVPNGRRKIRFNFPRQLPDESVITGTHGMAYLYPQGFTVDEEANEILITYAPNGGDGGDGTSWIAVHDWESGERKAIFSAGRWSCEGIGLVRVGSTRYIFVRYEAGVLARYDITTYPADYTVLTPDAIETSLPFGYQVSSWGNRLFIEAQGAPYGQINFRMPILEIDPMTFAILGTYELPHSLSGTGGAQHPYPKRQAFAAGPDFFVAAVGAAADAPAWGGDGLDVNQGVAVVALDGQTILRHNIGKPSRIAEILRNEAGIPCNRVENEGVWVARDLRVFSMWVTETSTSDTFDESGLVIIEEFSEDPDAIEFGAAIDAYGLSPLPRVWHPARVGSDMLNPLTGGVITTIGQICDIMYATGVREVSFATTTFPNIAGPDGSPLPNARLVRIMATTYATFFVYIDANQGMRRWYITGSPGSWTAVETTSRFPSENSTSGTTGFATILVGEGDPENSITALPGSLWLRTDGGAGTTLYVKESGTGNTGWVAK